MSCPTIFSSPSLYCSSAERLPKPAMKLLLGGGCMHKCSARWRVCPMNCHSSAVLWISSPSLWRTRSSSGLVGLPETISSLAHRAFVRQHQLRVGSSTSPSLCCQPWLVATILRALCAARAWVAPEHLERQPPGCDQLSSHKKKKIRLQMFSLAKHVTIYSSPHWRDTAGEKGLQLIWQQEGDLTVLGEPWKDAGALR